MGWPFHISFQAPASNKILIVRYDTLISIKTQFTDKAASQD